MDWRFSPKSQFSLLARLALFCNVPLPPFWFRNPNLSLMVYERCKTVKSLYFHFRRVILLNWTARGLKVLADIFYAFCRASSFFYRCGTAAFSALESLAILYLFILYLKVSLTRQSLFNSTLRQSEIQAHVILLSCFASSCVWRVMCQSIEFGLEILVFLIGFPKLASFNLSLSLHLCAFRVSIFLN